MKNQIICLNTVMLVIIALIFHIHKSQVIAYLYEYVNIFKCCPEGSELTVTDGQDGKRIYDCDLTKGNNEENQTLFGYNFYISDENQIPKCGDVEIFDFDEDGGLISSDGCIDWYDGVLHGLRCSDKFQVEVHRLYKCCPEGFSYDITNRECILSQQAPEDFVNLIGSSVAIFQTKVPTCQVNEVFVEYQTDIHPSTLIRSGIKLSTTEFEFLEPGTFCIDGIVNVGYDIKENATIIKSKEALIIRSCRPRNRCGEIPCVRRCCSNDQIMERIDGKVQCMNYTKNIKPTFHDVRSFSGFEKSYRIVEPSVYGVINKQNCVKFILSNDDPKEVHYISHTDGSLYVNNFDEPFSNDDYCIELVKRDSIDIHTFVCFHEYSTTKFKYYAAGLTVSCVFLGVTLICYACLPKVLLLNLHGKTLVCHVISLLSAYISLAIVQFHTETQIKHCLLIAFFIFFGFLAAFCWQSIMCFDIWWTFGSVSRGMRKTKELRRFLLYSLYAWGVPTLLTALTILVDHWHLIPDLWSPQMGKNNVCWFAEENKRGHFIFFLFPIGLHIFINAILFILTAIHCNKVKNEINHMQCSKDNEAQDKKRKFLADKAKYTMNIKLFIVMGVSWSLEILATLLQKYEYLWYASDWFNILQGVFVFFIFVFKAKVWEAILQRLGRAPKRSKGPTTVTTQLSVTSNGKLGKSASTSTISTSNTNLNVIRKVV